MELVDATTTSPVEATSNVVDGKQLDGSQDKKSAKFGWF